MGGAGRKCGMIGLPGPRVRPTPTAFTLVELLVTVAILTIVLAVVIESGQYIRNQGLTRLTKDLLAQVDTALEVYAAVHHGSYPPDRFVPGQVVPIGPHNPRTEGVEALVWALGHSGAERFWESSQFQRTWTDTDGDANKIDHQPLFELVDGWGRPLLYYHGYGAGPEAAEGGRLPKLPGLDDARMDELHRSLSQRWVHATRRPLVDSAGPDGVLNNSDDARRTDE